MRIRVNATEDLIEILEGDDLTRLDLVCDNGSAELAAMLDRTGFGSLVADDQTLIDADQLRDLAEAGARSADWSRRWQRMVHHAEQHGWTTPDGRSLYVHVVPADA